MPATYEPIATTTLGSAAASITFSSIASSWTDLRVVLTCTVAVAGQPFIRFNNDSTTLYSRTYVLGNGAAASSGRNSTGPLVYLLASGNASTTIPSLYTIDLFSYAGSTNKTFLITSSNDQNGSGTTHSMVGLYRSTSAITRIDLLGDTNYAAGTTATLYGIKNA